MKAGRASRTAWRIAAIRAAETHWSRGRAPLCGPLPPGLPRPCFRAIVALSRLTILRELLLRWVYDRRLPGALASTVYRTRTIRDLLQEALGDGVSQGVILVAGFDSRPYRVVGIGRARFFEVDHPATQAVKRARLERMLGRPPARVVFVPIDFMGQKLDEALAAWRVTGGRPSIFVSGNG